jgi:hypothetical protein
MITLIPDPDTPPFRPQPPTAEHLAENYELGRRFVSELEPIQDVEVLWQVYKERTRYPEDGVIAAFFNGLRDGLDAVRKRPS